MNKPRKVNINKARKQLKYSNILYFKNTVYNINKDIIDNLINPKSLNNGESDIVQNLLDGKPNATREMFEYCLRESVR